MDHIELLLSLPPAAVQATGRYPISGTDFVTADPPGSQLGSGGGTAYLLSEALKKLAPGISMDEWFTASRKMVIHGSGQSRRLPGYAAEGKPLLPLPIFSHSRGQSPGKRLLDIQKRYYERLFWHAPEKYRLMIACGDVLIRNDDFPPIYPDADVLIIGLEAPPEEACNHGVMFCSASNESNDLSFFLQKPRPSKISDLSRNHSYYLDTGIWLFSERAIRVLMSLCGWDQKKQGYSSELPENYDLYDSFGLSLGRHPQVPHDAISSLSSAVLPLPNGTFYHFGTNRSIITSTKQLQVPTETRKSFGHGSLDNQLNQIIIHSDVGALLSEQNQYIWIENSVIPSQWNLRQKHVFTGIPDNQWTLDIPAGVSIDILNLRDDSALCARVYGFDDPFRGDTSAAETVFLGESLREWLIVRGIGAEELESSDSGTDIQSARIFPATDSLEILGGLLEWMISDNPSPEYAGIWRECRRLSAAELGMYADIEARQSSRREKIYSGMSLLDPDEWKRSCRQLDLERVARMVENGLSVPPNLPKSDVPGLEDIHDAMFRSRIGTGNDDAAEILRELMVGQAALEPVEPTRNILEDQIIWGRSPARLDLAGGWTDTPPYCLENGGCVVNLAVNLNGQPPIQVFARATDSPHIMLRSIDLGIEEKITTYKELLRPPQLGGGFGIARAALRIAGMDPEFNLRSDDSTLASSLKRIFGGGIELSMLAAIPKGSGLGTSSILASTLLGTLSELFGLGWSNVHLFTRTLALEQMLTSGGGWQDQAGGLFPGLKMIETSPGISQYPMTHWLPDQQIRNSAKTERLLLYYTGITRVAHNILGEIVRGIFLNDANRLSILGDIRANAYFAADVIQKQDWNGLCVCIRRSWELNQRLDAGTNPPRVQQIFNRIAPWMAAGKLLGAGGGGYLLILAHDEQAGANIREELTSNPPNPRARFVDVSVSSTGFQVTRS